MGKGKNKPNAYSAFMAEYKRIEERKGRRFPGGFADLQKDQEFNNAWMNLSKDEKEYYKEIAKGNKKTSTGELVNNLQKLEQKAREFQDNMIEFISDMVKEAKVHKILPDMKFFLIHVNYFYYRQTGKNENEYYPAEIAIGEFTLKNGVSKIYHTIVNETPKIGYYRASKEHSDNSHQIPVEAEFGKSDYYEIFHEICQFLKPEVKDGKYPPIYTASMLDDIYKSTKSVLSRLALANNESDEFFTLYSFEDFFAILCNSIDDPDIVHPFDALNAKIEIQKDPDDYRTDFCCYYHEVLLIGKHCSQSIIQRWFSILRKFCWKEI